MKPGSVTVDLAAEAGGNIETTVKDQRIVTDNGVICLGYTDLPSRLANTASSLYANNISKFLLSIGPQTTKQAGYYFIDHNDEAVRGMLVVEEGKLMYPAPLPPPPPVVEKKEEETKPVEIDYKAPYVSGAKTAGLTSLAVLGMGAVAPNPAFSSMFTTFALSNVIGVQVVLGVTHALHSPLMAVTNAISGMWLAGLLFVLLLCFWYFAEVPHHCVFCQVLRLLEECTWWLIRQTLPSVPWVPWPRRFLRYVWRLLGVVFEVCASFLTLSQQSSLCACVLFRSTL